MEKRPINKIADNFKVIEKKGKEVGAGLRTATAGYITTALGLVAGLAWNDAIKSFIEYLFPVAKDTVFARFIYAVAITFAVVLISRWLIIFFGSKKEEKK